MADPGLQSPTVDPNLNPAFGTNISGVDSSGSNLSNVLGSLGTGTQNVLNLSGLGSALSGLYDLFGNGGLSMSGIANQAAQAADPFANQRSQYQGMLHNLMTNPSSFALSPAAQSQLDIGSQNLQRQAAAQGFLGSGNILAGLQSYGQQIANQDYYNQINELNLLSGAQTGSPATAGALLASLYGQRNNAMSNLSGGSLLSSLSGGLNSLGGLLNSGIGAIGSLFGGSSGSGLDLSNLQSLFSGTGSTDLTSGAVDQSLANYIGLGNTSTSGFNFNDLGNASSVGSSLTDFGLGSSTDTGSSFGDLSSFFTG